jgi:hypothetical protein
VTADAATEEIPLFPLQAVLFPGGPLPLRIFEPRYVDLVCRCLKSQAGFGGVVFGVGGVVGGVSALASVGT